MLLKHQDLCYSSPASSASWPHHMVSPEGPRQIVLGELIIKCSAAVPLARWVPEAEFFAHLFREPRVA